MKNRAKSTQTTALLLDGFRALPSYAEQDFSNKTWAVNT